MFVRRTSEHFCSICMWCRIWYTLITTALFQKAPIDCTNTRELKEFQDFPQNKHLLPPHLVFTAALGCGLVLSFHFLFRCFGPNKATPNQCAFMVRLVFISKHPTHSKSTNHSQRRNILKLDLYFMQFERLHFRTIVMLVSKMRRCSSRTPEISC